VEGSGEISGLLFRMGMVGEATMSNKYRKTKPERIAPKDRRIRNCLTCNITFTTHKAYRVCPECTLRNKELDRGAIAVHYMGWNR
jgi:rubrerythrin